MRYIRYALIAAFGIVLISLALANRGMVTLKAVPDGLAGIVGANPTITLPLFVVIFGGIIVGLFVGFVWEWMREHKHRADAAQKTRIARRLERENDRLRQEKHEGKDDVLALLDKTG